MPSAARSDSTLGVSALYARAEPSGRRGDGEPRHPLAPAREVPAPSNAAGGPGAGVAHASDTLPAHAFARIPIHHAAPREVQAHPVVNVPGDRHEQEAERVSEQVMGMGAPMPRPADGASPGAAGSHGGGGRTAPPVVQQTVRSGGQPLDTATRAFMEPRFGHDFGRVRVHADGRAAESARAVSARAYTLGHHVVFAAGQFAPASGAGRRLLAHELTHVVQQEGTGARVQRYESGEHVQLGETDAELTAAITASSAPASGGSAAPATYTVKAGEQLPKLAKRFSVTPQELKAANPGKVRKWAAFDGSGRIIEGFNANETIAIPQKLAGPKTAPVADKSTSFTVNGVVLEYGVGIAMGDFFATPADMAAAKPAEIKAIAELIRRERGGKPVTTEEWEKATGGRYLKLAEANTTHFAPPNASFVAVSAAGTAGPNHKAEWEKHHAAALKASQAGKRDEALMTNAFADHFLTDAFSAGHLANKLDLMERFKGQLTTDAKGEFTATSLAFFDGVAKDAFTGDVKKEFSLYETVEYKGVIFRPNIDSESRFSSLLQAIHQEEPGLLANAVAKGVHDRLNTLPGGLPVENNKGDKWALSGDGTLNTATRDVARRAVAQSQLNVLSSIGSTGSINTAELFKRVWEFTPRPDAAGAKQLVSEINKGTEINSADLRAAMVKLIKENYKLIIAELVKRNKLKKA
jgi:LysM repeat protein